jgi:lysophospholipase L1-like esterase
MTTPGRPPSPPGREADGRPGALVVLVGLLALLLVVWSVAIVLEGDDGDGAAPIGPLPGGRTEAVLGAVGSGAPALAVVGDSILHGAVEELEVRLGDAWELRVDAVSGATAAQQVDAAVELAALEPPADQLVVDLGTNDVTGGVALAESVDAIERIMASHPQARCVHLVTVTDRRRDAEGITRWPEAEELNAALRGLTSDPRVRIVDWADLLRQADGAEPALLVDLVHPSPAGNEVLVDAIAESVEACG